MTRPGPAPRARPRPPAAPARAPRARATAGADLRSVATRPDARHASGDARAASGIDRGSPEPLYRQLAARLAADIDAGRLAPGDRLPSEPELMAAHGVSRVTVRQAAAMLRREGRIDARRGKGTFVRGAVLAHDLDALRGFHDALVGQGVEPDTRLLEFSADAGAADPRRPADADLPVRLQRLYAVGRRPFALVVGWLPAAAAALPRERAERLPVYRILDVALGVRVARAEVAIRSQAADAPVARALGLARGAPLLVMDRRSYDADGRTCEAMRIHIVPDRFEFRLAVPGPLELARSVQRTGDPSSRPHGDRR